MVTLLQEAFNYVTAFNTDMVLSLGLVVVTMLLISKKTQDWKYLALPVTIMWHVVGITPNFMQYLATGFFWVFNVFKIEMITRPIQVATDLVSGVKTRIEDQEIKKEIKERTDKAHYSKISLERAKTKYFENRTPEETPRMRIIR